MTFAYTRVLAAVALVLALPLAACGGGLAAVGAGVAGAALPSARTQQGEETREVRVTGEVREVDELQQRILLTTEDGRSGSVRYDGGTVVVRQQQQYPVRTLERGDGVVVEARQDPQGIIRAVRIDVHRAAADARREVAGTVIRIDAETRELVVGTEDGEVTVWLPSDAPTALAERFRALAEGDEVRVEATSVTGGRLFIHRFP
ncbi:MAG TPA: hypothetical protein VK936_06750 [Longimicrobiales bacterium]|nr:hypothetical protein [Longimicrobiales bacterium]